MITAKIAPMMTVAALLIPLSAQAFAKDTPGRLNTKVKVQTTLNEAQIERILLIAVTSDADTAKEAIDAAHNIRIQGYADDVLRDSTALKAELDDLTRNGPALQDSSESRALSARADADLDSLRGTYGSPFEHEYLRQQMEAQGDLVDLIDQQLTPAAKPVALQNLLSKARQAAAKHYLFAKQLRGDLEPH